jgi:cell wall-associated NlpC family hydrolase
MDFNLVGGFPDFLHEVGLILFFGGGGSGGGSIGLMIGRGSFVPAQNKDFVQEEQLRIMGAKSSFHQIFY